MAAKLLVSSLASSFLRLGLGTRLVSGTVALANVEGAYFAAALGGDENLQALAALGDATFMDANVGGEPFGFVVLNDGGASGASVLGLGGFGGVASCFCSASDDEKKSEGNGDLAGEFVHGGLSGLVRFGEQLDLRIQIEKVGERLMICPRARSLPTFTKCPNRVIAAI